MTASAIELRSRLLLLPLLLGLACSGTSGPPPAMPLEPLPSRGAFVPDAADLAARQAGVAAFASDRDALETTRVQVAALDQARHTAGEPVTGLLPYVMDLESAIGDDTITRREASRALLARDDLDAALRTRLEQESRDDPIHLAQERLGDARRLHVARVFNALVEPVGRSLTSGLTSGFALPLRLTQAVTGLAVAEHLAPELSTPERQALGHWKRFIEEYGDTEEAAALVARVEESQRRWYDTRREQAVRLARQALEEDRPAAAALMAERALRYGPEDGEASRLHDEAQARLERERAALTRSLQAAPDVRIGGRALAVALLGQPDRVEAEAHRLLAANPRGPLADEARFALALADAEVGRETQSWEALEDLTRHRDGTMARHAWALLAGPQNPERLFRMARSRETGNRLRWLGLGPLASGARDRDLPRTAEWALEIPTVVDVAVGLPDRLLRFPWRKPEDAAPVVHARSYLARYPDGEHAAELRKWLIGRESDRDHWLAALQVAEEAPDIDPEELAGLREHAARQALEGAQRQRRRDVRLNLLRHVAREFEDTPAGEKAGAEAQTLVRDATPQHIRVSRGFLYENPEVAGPDGLALQPALLDGELDNGELHRDGVTLLGGLVVELAFVDPDGGEKAEPLRRRQHVSEERLARVVAILEEVTIRNAQLDPDLEFVPDADRDLFFERARLGVADSFDPRPSAESTYSFVSTRERFGMVRSRESILPVELVLQVSGTDLGIGAFPRLRPPRPTADSILFQ